MPDRRPKHDRATLHADKLCKTCGRAFAWRKKWEKDWDVIKYCSDACRGHKPAATDTALEAAILTLLAERGRDKTITPTIGRRWMSSPAKATPLLRCPLQDGSLHSERTPAHRH